MSVLWREIFTFSIKIVCTSYISENNMGKVFTLTISILWIKIVVKSDSTAVFFSNPMWLFKSPARGQFSKVDLISNVYSDINRDILSNFVAFNMSYSWPFWLKLNWLRQLSLESKEAKQCSPHCVTIQGCNFAFIEKSTELEKSIQDAKLLEKYPKRTEICQPKCLNLI